MAFKFKKGDRVFLSEETTIWIVEQIGIDGKGYMVAQTGAAVKILDWVNEEDLRPVFNPLIQ